jgi:hypothetical protein
MKQSGYWKASRSARSALEPQWWKQQNARLKMTNAS